MTRVLLISLIAAISMLGCGVYSFSSAALGGVKSISVPQFENQSTEYGINEDLTTELINRFIEDNTLKIASANDADAVLRGTVVSYERTAYTYELGDIVNEYKVNIVISYVIERKDGKVLTEKSNMLGWGIYDVDTDAEEDGQQEAISKLARDIVDETTKSW
jgi:hypothetical protein